MFMEARLKLLTSFMLMSKVPKKVLLVNISKRLIIQKSLSI
jgi:hypothetical protein